MNEFGRDFISISDEDGNEFELLILDEADLNGTHYLALTESKTPEAEPDPEIIILKVIEDDSGEELLSTVDTEAELEAIYQVFEDQMFSDDDPDEDDDYDE